MKRLIAVALALGLLAPGIALACAVCGAGQGRSQAAFFETTIFLSLLPLGLIGWGLTWLYRGGREWMAGEFNDRDSGPSS